MNQPALSGETPSSETDAAGASSRRDLFRALLMIASIAISKLESKQLAMAEELKAGKPLETSSLEGNEEPFRAEPTPEAGAAQELAATGASPGEIQITDRIAFQISIDGRDIGRIVIGLYGQDVPLGASRFSAIARGDKGVSFRRKEFTKLTETFVQCAGLRSFSLGGGGEGGEAMATFPGGTSAAALQDELEKQLQQQLKEGSSSVSSSHSSPGTVSLVVLDPTIPPPKTRLVAKDGKFINVEEIARPPPNGTEFAITFSPSPELDATNLVVGRVVEGWEVLEELRKVPFVRNNSDNGYFKTAKLIGDRRATVAERGFNRPFSKILISKSSIL